MVAVVVVVVAAAVVVVVWWCVVGSWSWCAVVALRLAHERAAPSLECEILPRLGEVEWGCGVGGLGLAVGWLGYGDVMRQTVSSVHPSAPPVPVRSLTLYRCKCSTPVATTWCTSSFAGAAVAGAGTARLRCSGSTSRGRSHACSRSSSSSSSTSP